LKKNVWWIENLVTSAKIFKTINYGVLPEDKWLLVGLLNNTTQSCALLVFYFYSE